VSRTIPSGKRSTLTEIYVCHACSCHEIEDMETPGQVRRGGAVVLGGGAVETGANGDGAGGAATGRVESSPVEQGR
jgi:hypothetical protein